MTTRAVTVRVGEITATEPAYAGLDAVGDLIDFGYRDWDAVRHVRVSSWPAVTLAELWLATAPVLFGDDNAALMLTDADSVHVLGVIPIDTWHESKIDHLTIRWTEVRTVIALPPGGTRLYGRLRTVGAMPAFNGQPLDVTLAD